ncbi:hypothetical protein [Endozoicomonas arenosclerae]|uniref:hypothetical protein n=1 Tax=Endozoicomonas arenosclerae TaxID=1633495 RepID=UPI00078461A9|nr:hypothetical protein [Endozoicomonas arenosclerae]
MIKKYTSVLTTAILASTLSFSVQASEWFNSKDGVGNTVAHTESTDKTTYLFYTRIDGDEKLQVLNKDTYYLRDGDEINVTLSIDDMEDSYYLEGTVDEGMLVIHELDNYREMKGLSAQMKMSDSLSIRFSFEPRDEKGNRQETVDRVFNFSLDGSSRTMSEAYYN